jgi:D-glycero-D-manno-heptose 1,7-bisphosphate phosphatase
VLVSNQGGVAAGYRTLDDQIIAERYTLGGNPYIVSSYFCPDWKGETLIYLNRYTRVDYDSMSCPLAYRKPAPGSFLLISKFHKVEPKNCISVGVFPEDRSAANFLDILHFTSLGELKEWSYQHS